MSFQPPQQQGPPPSPEAQREQRVMEILEQTLGGELPGEGYLFAADPQQRQESLVKTTPEFVRDVILRAIETLGFDAMLPYGATPKADAAKAILALSQSYLLLDPSVDESGVEVGAGAKAQGEAQEGAAAAQGEATIAAQQHAHELAMQKDAQAHAHAMQLASQQALAVDPETFKRGEPTGAHVEPPRVQPNRAEKAIEEKNKGKTDVLKGARGDLPRPKPRVGS